MKRSEALVALKLYLTDKPLDEDWLFHILDAVESIGMLPPFYETVINGQHKPHVGQWEPEDE